MLTPQPRPDLHAAIELRYPDNTSMDITPKDLRDGLHELVDSAFVLASDQLPPAQVTAQLLGIDPATKELLLLLSPDAPTKPADYVLADYTAALSLVHLVGASITSRLLRLPLAAQGKTLCLLDAAGQPVPLQHLEQPLATRNAYGVSAAKRRAVADTIIAQVKAGGPPYLDEPDGRYLGCIIVDNRPTTGRAIITCHQQDNPATSTTEFCWYRMVAQ